MNYLNHNSEEKSQHGIDFKYFFAKEANQKYAGLDTCSMVCTQKFTKGKICLLIGIHSTDL